MENSIKRLAGSTLLACFLTVGSLFALNSLIRADGNNDYQQDLTGMPDLIYGNAGADYIDGADGDDWLSGNADNDQLFGGRGQDRLVGGYGDDKLDGGPNSDWLFGGRDNDSLNGGPENDVLYGDFGDYMVAESAGAGLKGSFDDATGNVTIVENGKSYGGDKMIFGTHGSGNMSIEGNLTVDVGDDVLDGGPGDDVLYGGGGKDRFVFGSNCGHDTIKDYEAGEEIDVKAFAGKGVTQSVENGSTVIAVDGVVIVTLENYKGAVAILQ